MARKKTNGADYRVLERGEELLDVELTDAEIRERAQEAARVREERDDLIDRKAAQAKRFKAQIDSADTRIGNLLRAVSRGIEEREVVTQTHLYADRVEVVRMDTGEVIRSREPLEHELQEHMDLGAQESAEA